MQCGDGRGRTWLSETSPWFGPRSLPAIYAYSHAGPSFSLRVKATPLYPTLDTGAGERRVVSHLNTLAGAPW